MAKAEVAVARRIEFNEPHVAPGTRRIVTATMRALKVVAGFGLLLAGLVLLVLPGPGWLTIVGGLALLSTEYAWARRLLDSLKHTATQIRQRLTRRRSNTIR